MKLLVRFRKAIRVAALSLQCVRPSERVPLRSAMLRPAVAAPLPGFHPSGAEAARKTIEFLLKHGGSLEDP